MISLQRVLNSSLSLRLASALARGCPPRLGYGIASFLAEQIARQRNSNVVRAIRTNQWVIHKEKLSGEALDQVVRETLVNSARCIFELYHYIQDYEAVGQFIVLEPSFQEIARRPEFDRRGLMIAGLHLSNFDLILQWLCRRMMTPLVLTIPDPQGGRRMEYELRKRTGMNLVPGSLSAVRQCIKHLQRGGMVVTGIDRPVTNPEARPCFFGRPAALPMHHVFLAAKAQVPLVIAVTNFQSDGKYHVFASDLIEMDHDLNPAAAMLRNAEKVLGVAEQLIRRVPQQWSVPLPVWPQMMDQVPR